MANTQGIAALVLSGIALLLSIVGTAIPYWSYGSSDETTLKQYTGLWKICNNFFGSDQCEDIPSEVVPGWIKATRAMEIIGILLIGSTLICGFLKLFVTKTQDILPKVALATGIAAGVFMLLGAIVYGAKYLDLFDRTTLHAGFGLVIVAAIFSILSGIFYGLAGQNGQI